MPSCCGPRGAHLGDLGVGALHAAAGPVEPEAGGDGAVLAEGASVLAAAPATLELPVGLQAEAAALPLGCTLVEMDCKERRTVRDGVGEDVSQFTFFSQG